jgi:hypothetical protein
MDPLLGAGPPLPEEGPSFGCSMILFATFVNLIFHTVFNPDYLPTVGVSRQQDGEFFKPFFF